MQTVRVAIVGGGSPFVHTLLHGIATQQHEWSNARASADLALYDIEPGRAVRWARYAALLRRRLDAPVSASVAESRADALRDAQIVLLSAGAPGAYGLAERMRTEYRFPFHSIHDGPPGFAAARLLFPFCRELCEEASRLAPRALVVLLPNPTDALANACARATGVDVVGFCVEVEQSRDYLAYYCGLDRDDIGLDHAGVNHDGWILRLRVAGQDGYQVLRDRLLSLPDHPWFHPGNWGWCQIYRATGLLRSSAFHNWPIEVEASPRPRTWEEFGYARVRLLSEVDDAIRTQLPVSLDPSVHPANRPVMYAGSGIALSRIALGRATPQTCPVPLQVRNNGSVSDLPNDVQVEVPTLIRPDGASAVPVGPLPPDAAGTTRLLALQRRLEADWLLDGRKETLLRALMTVPTVARVDTFLAFADELSSIRP